MPWCIIVVNDISLPSPGFRVVEPTTGLKGQHPSSIFTSTSSTRRVSSPTLANSKA